MAKCEDCQNCIWDGEYWDTGQKAYDAWYCRVRKGLEDNEHFPFANTKCKHFIMDFWKSEFANEVDGSDESLQLAMKKWKEKYKA